ncbi:nitrate ABC transporter [Cutibacterium avidum]|uniref:Nitrate ABC transporter n=1 Tax=Cutibacterium avidum TaxID=33010 RepID=A0A3E2DN98_9ACTN|nr:nitrate ABC transporter [Cutibacterium avidum]MBS5744746.1 nitrate ABC transporter [Propionibacterium sp.]MDU7815746.1 nitrate ABC transporter [Bacillota bacterium]MDK7359352.1 nitrate ABC transporter [Cutibacterium avidum]MDK7371917.1 nitrate ABC transporter [Cutibacterium avidum]MDU2071247.1 nitrate ABC transporter [Cutibacterium avidum]
MLISRADVTDIWFEEGEALVIVEDSVIRLSPLAVAIWGVLETPSELEELGSELEALIGPPPQGNMIEILTTSIEDLSRHHVLTVS